jgi:hypothetical protein
VGSSVFLVTLVAVRLGHKPSLSPKTPFDAVLLVILAAVLSRAISGSAAFFATLGGDMVLVALHRLFAFPTFCSHRFGILVRGRRDVIVRDGECDVPMMWRNHVSTHDLGEDMRLSYSRTTFPGFELPTWNAAVTSASSKNKLTHMAYDLMESPQLMRTKKRWIKPTLKTVPIFFECTCYAGAV